MHVSKEVLDFQSAISTWTDAEIVAVLNHSVSMDASGVVFVDVPVEWKWKLLQEEAARRKLEVE